MLDDTAAIDRGDREGSTGEPEGDDNDVIRLAAVQQHAPPSRSYVDALRHRSRQSAGNSLLCGPISPVVNLEMSSTARFFCGNAIYGCSGLGNCRMLNFLSIAFCVIDLISILIR